MLNLGSKIYAQVASCCFLVSFDVPVEIKNLLAQLNGPVGEVPYK
jgi:hypothetical protein